MFLSYKIIFSLAQNEPTIVDFANRLTHLNEQMTSSYKNKHNKAVTLSTIHSAKGLEWEQVYLIDLIEGIIPERETIKAEQGGKKELSEEEDFSMYDKKPGTRPIHSAYDTHPELGIVPIYNAGDRVF